MKLLRTIWITDALKNKDFSQYIIGKSIHRANYALFIIGLFEILMLTVSFLIPDSFDPILINVYRSHYAFLALTCLILRSIFVSEIKKQVINTHKLTGFFLLALTISVGWGASVTLLDITKYPQLTVYLTFILLISAGSLASPVYMTAILIFVQIIFIRLIPYYQSDVRIIFNTSVNSSVFILFAIFVSRQIFYDQYVDFIKDVMINENTKALSATNQRLFEISQLDPLTGIYNRLALERIISDVWVHSIHTKTPITILMIDVDQFKVFNDRYGHLNGDRCLVKAAQVLSSVAQAHQGNAFRFGGDEFCLVISEQSDTSLTTILSELNHLKSMSIELLSGENVEFLITIGYASTSSHQVKEPWELLDLADKELYRVKQARHKVVQ